LWLLHINNKILKSKLKSAIRKKRSGVLSIGSYLFCDNTHAHSAAATLPASRKPKFYVVPLTNAPLI